MGGGKSELQGLGSKSGRPDLFLGWVSQATPWLVTFHVPHLDPGFSGPWDHLMHARSRSKINCAN